MATRTSEVREIRDGVLVDTRTMTWETTSTEDVEATLLTQRQARLTTVRSQAQGIAATSGTLTGAQLSNSLRTLAAAVDDIAQFEIRLARRVLALYDAVE